MKRGRRIVHANPWYRIRHEKVQWEEGSSGDYFTLESTGQGSVIVIAERGGELLVLEQIRYPSKRNSLEFCGGIVERKENILRTARKELQEETGYRAHVYKNIGSISLNSSLSNYPLHIFFATKLKSSSPPSPENSEKIKRAFWISHNALRAAIREGRMFDAASLAAWSLYEAWRKG